MVLYFGKDKPALRLSKETFEEFGHFIPLATWVGGLSVAAGTDF